MTWPSPRPVAPAATIADAQAERALAAVRDALGRLRFGTIALTVHDGRVMQLEISEKQRFDA